MTTYLQTAIEDAMQQAPPAAPAPVPPPAHPGDGPARLGGIVDECWARTRELRKHVGGQLSIARSNRERIRHESGFDVAPSGAGTSYDPYSNVTRDALEAVVRAAASAHQPPEILMAIWQREGSLGMPLTPWPVPQASTAVNARILARSDIFWEKLGTDHFTAARPNPAGGENIYSHDDADAAAHQTRFRAAIRELVTGHQLASDVSAAIDAELTAAARTGAGFDVTPTIRFYGLSLLLIDALFTKLWQNTFPEATTYGPMLNYQQWNQGRFERFLRSAEHHRHEAAYRAADGSAPSLEQWAYHTQIKAKEFAQPRRNAIRFGYMMDCFAPIFAPALAEIRRSAPGAAAGAGTPAAHPPAGQSLTVALEDPIEGYQYDPTGTTCATSARPGAVALLHELQSRYRGRSDGILNCRPVRGGTRLSLHGEGRAVDWRLNAADADESAEAQRIIDWLLAADTDGNADALARRMGVQEIIWNRQIWSARRHAEGFRPYNGVNPHTEHLHIGLNHAGAEARTSYWRAHPSAAAAAPSVGGSPAAAQALSLPGSALHWEGATPEQLDFMRRVYEVQLRRAERARAFVGDVPANELAVIEAGTKARTGAAAACRELLSAGRSALAAAQGTRDSHAAAVERISLVSGYRSASQQLAAWQANFPMYYERTRSERQRMPGGEHGEQAVEVTARYVGARLAAPGFSLHNNGLAIDFGTRESGNDLGAHTNDESLRRWKASWLFAWLRAHAADCGFFQNTTIDEPWHWEFRGHPTATAQSWARPLAAITAQTLPVNDLALLHDHHDVNPDLILRWNDMPGVPEQLDVVVHLHGFSAAHHLDLKNKLPISGLDFAPPVVPPGSPPGTPAQPTWIGRARPTLCILPRGKCGEHPRSDGIWPYRFPAITRAASFRSLIDESIARFCSAVGASGPVPVGRMIITAHSGGGAPLDAILAFTERLSLDPHEIHVFDALYGGTGNIERWLARRLGDDARRLAAGVPDPARFVRETAGAMRIYFIDGAGTQTGSRRLDGAAAHMFPAGAAYSSQLRERYRAETTGIPHPVIPYWYGGRLLADAGQTIPRR